MADLQASLGNLRLSEPRPEQPPSGNEYFQIKPASLLGLSDELLAIICSHVMIDPGSERQHIDKVFAFPQGVIPDRINDHLRILLRPFRCHPRLYRIGRHEFLASNLAVLNSADLKASAAILLPASVSPRNSILLLKSLVHVQCHVSVSDLRAPFTQRFNTHHVDVLNMDRECEQLRRMSELCPNLKTLHLFLKIDEWYLMPTGPDIRMDSGRPMTEREVRYRGRAQTVVQLVRSLPLGRVTVAFHHWRKDVAVLDMRDMATEKVIDVILAKTVPETWDAPIARVNRPKLSTSWVQSSRKSGVVVFHGKELQLTVPAGFLYESRLDLGVKIPSLLPTLRRTFTYANDAYS
ncbi:uncharacterized protein RCC_08889 [Ramularia collo-cygni]|uniref:Uncharacterized protein n=1 Tax=Ramularia collo-cygni TaxID=112498 RepID=A0A2D3VIT5_9PEZI|nr:uncharacterized protein RCC_08889 [Ramularia collo-cygni]CZT23179.1 uncharacterized protein RCC_08889 [Ramularia collo-cygni]